MRTFGNVLWHFPFLGFVNAALVWLLGAVLTMTVIAAPIGLGLMQYAKFLLAPFSREMVKKADLRKTTNGIWSAYALVVSILFLPLGLLLALLSIVQIALLFVSILGIPVGIVVAKSLPTMLNPIGKICVPAAVRDELERRRAQQEVQRHMGPA